MTQHRYAYQDLLSFTTRLFHAAGLPQDRATILAQSFLEADLLGFRTHGINRVNSNLEWLESGDTKGNAEPAILVDKGAVLSWDANYLPGPYVMALAVDTVCERAKQFGQASLVLRKAQHIASLATYLNRAVEQGLVIQILCSSPADSCVSAYGGSEPIFSPNPFAFGAPSSQGPILIDMSLSIVAEGYVAKALRENTLLPSACLKNNRGEPSNDPKDYWDQPKGSIMPIGGLDHGYKGYGLCLWSELLCQALGNFGRADKLPLSEENTVHIQIYDPEAFGSLSGFIREADYLSALCRNSKVKSGDDPVRIPGDRAMALRSKQLTQGVEVSTLIMDDLKPWAEKFQLAMPETLKP